MARSIKLKWSSSNYRFGRDDGIRVRFEVVCATGLDHRIFAYRMLPTDQGGTEEAFFSHICSPSDIAEWPADTPRAGESPQWFRLWFVDIFVRSVTEADDFVAIVNADVNRLLATLAKMDTIFERGTVIAGSDCDPAPEPPPSEGSVGSSESLGLLASLVAVGTTEQSVGIGVSWISIGSGAGSPVGSSDSFGANGSEVTLQKGESSALLLVQGFDFSGLPDNAVIEGIESRVTLRDATADHVGSGGSGGDYSPTPDTCIRLTLLALQHPDLSISSNQAGNQCLGTDWETIYTGGDGDRWGYSSIPASLLKDGAFGVGIVVRASDLRAGVVDVDGVELEVFYKEVLS